MGEKKIYQTSNMLEVAANLCLLGVEADELIFVETPKKPFVIARYNDRNSIIPFNRLKIYGTTEAGKTVEAPLLCDSETTLDLYGALIKVKKKFFQKLDEQKGDQDESR